MFDSGNMFSKIHQWSRKFLTQVGMEPRISSTRGQCTNMCLLTCVAVWVVKPKVLAYKTPLYGLFYYDIFNIKAKLSRPIKNQLANYFPEQCLVSICFIINFTSKSWSAYFCCNVQHNYSCKHTFKWKTNINIVNMCFLKACLVTDRLVCHNCSFKILSCFFERKTSRTSALDWFDEIFVTSHRRCKLKESVWIRTFQSSFWSRFIDCDKNQSTW